MSGRDPSSLPLHLPAEQRFECTLCGRCCQAAWTIAVDPSAEASIRSSQAYRELSREGYHPLTTVSERCATARSADASCIFLQSDLHCRWHRELGGSKKPIVCQTYPYLLTETPDGIFATLSFACPPVLAQQGPLVSEQRSELLQMIADRWYEMPQGHPVGEMIALTSSWPIPWSDYLDLEAWIGENLAAEDPVDALLDMAAVLVGAEGDGVRPRAKPRVDPALADFTRQLASMVSCNLIALLEDLASPLERAQLGSALWNGATHRSTRFQLELPPFQLVRPLPEALRGTVERYLRQAVFGKRLLQGTVLSRLLALACGVAILAHYEFAFRCDGAEPAAALDRAFTLVESELLSHTRSFDGFFEEFEQALRGVYLELHGSLSPQAPSGLRPTPEDPMAREN